MHVTHILEISTAFMCSNDFAVLTRVILISDTISKKQQAQYINILLILSMHVQYTKTQFNCMP